MTLPPFTRAAKPWLALLLVLPLLVFTAGCDDDDDTEPPPPAPGNDAPTANFTVTEDGLTVDLDASTSDDSDGTIESYAWDFGDGNTGSGENTSHTYAASGEYTIELEVTDDDGATAVASREVNVMEPGMTPAEVVVTDDITADRTWSADTTYFLDGLIFVGEPTDGGIPSDRVELTIEPGTVIKGRARNNISTGEGASALIIRRSATINAAGTASEPIIMTSEQDDLDDPEDLIDSQFNPRRGLWGGLIVLGRASTNQGTTENQVEGIPDTDPAIYGGTDDDDDSGTITYLSLRHGGFSITGVPGDEINGLTMGAVGRGTTINHVEIFANFDDGFEWFGGTVHTSNLVAAFCGDDSFDYDQGFRGTGQFWFSIHDTDQAGRSGEHDGGDAAGDAATPFSRPVISNATYLGSGEGADGIGGDGNDRTFAIRDNAGGVYANSIFVDFPGVAVNIEDLDGTDTGDSFARFEESDLVFTNNVFFGYAPIGGDPEDDPLGAGEEDLDAEEAFGGIIEPASLAEDFAADNFIQDPELASITRQGTVPGAPVLNPIPEATDLPADIAPGDIPNPAGLDLSPITDVDYLGAFDPGASLWISGWTALDADGYLD